MNANAAFWFIAAALMAGSVAVIVIPMLKPAADGSTQRPKMKSVIIALALLIPAVVVGIYLKVGTPGALSVAGSDQRAPAPADMPAGKVLEGMDVMADRLAAKLAKNPKDGEGWALLGRAYVQIQKYPEASAAFEKAAALIKDDPQLLADYADALGVANGRSLAGKPTELAKKALALNPNHEKALLLVASAAFEAKNYREAIRYWQRVGDTAEPDSELARGMAANIAEARSLMGESAPAGAPGASLAQRIAERVADKPGSGASLSGKVVLASQLAGKVSPSDTVFIYARPLEGSRMPVAALKLRADRFPVSFTLDDSTAVSPNSKLSNHQEVTVVARVSKSGNAEPQAGDLLGTVKRTSSTTRDLQVVIDSVLP